MLKLDKYGLAAYFIASLFMLYSLGPLTAFSGQIFYALMALGVLLMFTNINKIFSKRSFHNFSLVYGYIIITIIYTLTFGIETFSFGSINYLLAKTTFTVFIIISVSTNPRFYYDKMYKWLAFLLPVLFFFGISESGGDFSGRFTFGFGNANAVGPLAAIAFGIFMIRDDFKKYQKYIGIAFTAFVVLVAGSRAGMILLIMAFLFKYKMKLKAFPAIFAFIVIAWFIMGQMGIEVTGLERLSNTYDKETGELVTNRDVNHQFTIDLIKEKPVTGHGLEAYKVIQADELVAQYGADRVPGTHNGYLSILKMYGMILGLILILLIVYRSLRIIKKYYKSEDPKISVHIFIITGVIILAFAEDYFVGVNQLITILFFVSVSVMEYYEENKKRKFLARRMRIKSAKNKEITN